MIRLIQMTDTHIYAQPGQRFGDVDTRESCARVIDALRRAGTPCDALVLSGDLAMDASAGAYAWLGDAIGDDFAPRYVLPGNHDDPARLAAAEIGAACAPACVRHGEWRIWLLDTHEPGCKHGELGAAQLSWFAHGLDEPHTGFDAVFLHHHPVPIGSAWMDAMGLHDATRFWSLLDARASVRVVVFGHVHQNFDCYRDGVRVLGTPSTCAQFMPRSRRYAVDARGPGYRVIDLGSDGQVTTAVVRVPRA